MLTFYTLCKFTQKYFYRIEPRDLWSKLLRSCYQQHSCDVGTRAANSNSTPMIQFQRKPESWTVLSLAKGIGRNALPLRKASAVVVAQQ